MATPAEVQQQEIANLRQGFSNMGAAVAPDPRYVMMGQMNQYRQAQANALATKSRAGQAYANVMASALIRLPNGRIGIDPTKAAAIMQTGAMGPSDINAFLGNINGDSPEANVKGGILSNAPKNIQYQAILPAGTQVSTAPDGSVATAPKAAPLKTAPAAAIAKADALVNMVHQIYAAQDAIKQNPGVVENPLAALPDAARSRIFSDPNAANALAAVTNVTAQKLHDTYGARVPDYEFNRIKPGSAQLGTPDSSNQARLGNGADSTEDLIYQLNNSYSPSAGFQPIGSIDKYYHPPVKGAPAPAAPSTGGAIFGNTPAPATPAAPQGAQPDVPLPTGGGSAAPAPDPLAGARAAIQAGAPRDAVVKRLTDNGIDPSGL